MEGVPRNYDDPTTDGQLAGEASDQTLRPLDLETGSLRSDLLSGRAQDLNVSVSGVHIRGNEFIEEVGTATAEELRPNDEREVSLDPEEYGYTEREYDL